MRLTSPVPPTITGTVSSQTTILEAPVKPFSGVTISDGNVGATDTLTITLGGARRRRSLTARAERPPTAGAGVYTLSGTAVAITGELDALVFTPTAAWPNSSGASMLNLSDASSASNAPAVSATVVTDEDPSVFLASAAYVAANIDALNLASHVTSITLTDSGTPRSHSPSRRR